jgi:hypothetical protein
LPRISAATAALLKAENSISYCETKSLKITKIRRNATKKKSTTGAISRIKPNSPPSIDADAVVSRARKVRFMTGTMAPCVSLKA